jgi:uncharacterized protein (TIGR00369 family)
MVATAIDRFPISPCSSLLGRHVIDARPSDGWIKLGFDGKRDFCNNAGSVQGGILAAMIEGTMAAAVFVMTDGKLLCPVISMTVNFLATAKPGQIIGEAKVTQLGKTIVFVEGKLSADDGTLLATATSSARVVETVKAIR